MKFVVTTIALGAYLTLGAVAQYRDPRFFNTRNFWEGFESGLHEVGKQVQKQIDRNLESTFDQISNIRDSVGSLSQTMENRVQQNLPGLLFSNSRSPNVGEIDDTPIEVIEGSIGNNFDGGVKVYLEGDSSRPFVIPQEEVNSFVDRIPVEPTVESVDLTTSSNIRPHVFGFGNIGLDTFNLDNLGHDFSFWRPRFSIPWYQGENVCVEEKVIDEPESSSTTTQRTTDNSDREPLFGEPEAESGYNSFIDADSTLPQSNQESMKLVEAEEEAEAVPSARESRFFFGSFQFSSCTDDRSTDRYVCTNKIHYNGKTTTKQVHRFCCPGYVKRFNECVLGETKNVPESLEQFDLTDFLTLAKTTDMVDTLNTTELTVFAPSNEAVQDFTLDYEESVLENEFEITDNEVYRKKRSLPMNMKSIVQSHLFNGLLPSERMLDEQVFYSLADNSSLRINVYEQEPVLKTVNCVPISTFNQFSKNGIIHTIEKVLEPVTQSIFDVINSQPRFSGLAKMLAGSDLAERLKQPGQFTLFAPSDDAFEKLTDAQLSLITSAVPCNAAVVENHVLPNVICSAAVRMPVSKTINLLENYLKLTQHSDGRLLVEDAHVTERDIVATNGVVHVVDSIMWPFEAKPPMEVLASNNFTKFVELLKAVDMADEINNLESSNVFAPEDDAFGDIQGFLDKAREDPESVKEVLRFHITDSPVEVEAFNNNDMLTTRSGHPMRINFNYGIDGFLFGRRRLRSITAGCSPARMNTARACGATIHKLETVMTPARHNILEHLKSLEHYSIFAKMVEESSMADIYNGPGPLTVMAPTDYVFRTLPDNEYTSLMEDKELKDRIVKRHTIPDHICCNSVCHGNFWSRCSEVIDSLGSNIRLHRTQDGILRVEGARITECGQPLKNGLVHKVNRLLEEPHVTTDQFARDPIDRIWPGRRHAVFRLFP